MGFDKCNTLVVGLLREALVAQGRAALGRLSAAERSGSVLLINMGRLLNDMGNLLEEQGKLVEAIPLRTEELEGSVLLHGMEHVETRRLARTLVSNLRKVGQREEAEALVDKHGLAEGPEARLLEEALEKLQGQRETLGDRDTVTLFSIRDLADLLEEQGMLAEAIPLLTEALEGYVLLFGMENELTRLRARRLVRNLRKVGQREEAEALAAKHGLAGH